MVSESGDRSQHSSRVRTARRASSSSSPVPHMYCMCWAFSSSTGRTGCPMLRLLTLPSPHTLRQLLHGLPAGGGCLVCSGALLHLFHTRPVLLLDCQPQLCLASLLLCWCAHGCAHVKPVAACRGVSFNQYFGDFTNYTNAWLHQHLAEGEAAHPGLAVSVESWRRQRNYIEWALQVRESPAAAGLPPSPGQLPAASDCRGNGERRLCNGAMGGRGSSRGAGCCNLLCT